MKEAIYAASLDPITLGHVNIVERALKVFDRILVGIGINEQKKALFSLEEREAMAKKELAQFKDRVVVRSFRGMLSDFAYENRISTIIRGARSTPDFDYEKLLSDINRYCGVDTIIYPSIPELSHISSSAAKALTLSAGKNILDFVSMNIKHRLEEELLNQYRIGVTGIIGSGKSYVAEAFYKFIKGKVLPGLEPHIVDMDGIGHYLLEEGKEPVCEQVRKDVCKALKIKNNGEFLNIKKLRRKIFTNNDLGYNPERDAFNKIMHVPMMWELRTKFLTKTGTIGRKSLIIVTGALLCEMKGLDELNNNLILVNAPNDKIFNRLKKSRGYTDEQVKQRINAQASKDGKGWIVDENIKRTGYGHCWFLNNDGSTNLEKFFLDVLKDMGCLHEKFELT